jgi:hypothetical protein
VSISPGVTKELFDHEVVFPVHFGYEDLFQVSENIASFMIAPTKFASASGLLFAAGRQMHSMSKSGLLPQCLSITYGSNQVPIAAMVTTSVIGLIVLFILWLTDPRGDEIYELSILGACVVYMSMFWCYLLFKVHYSSMDRTFTNPLGIASAIYGILYFAVVVASLLFLQLDFVALIAFVPLMILSVVYYYKVVESRQFFSKEEQQKFMKAYILNANRKKKKGLSPFMKRLRQVYDACGLARCFGPWISGNGSVGRDNSSIGSSAASSRFSNSRATSKVSAAKSSSMSSASKSISERDRVSETHVMKPVDEESGSVDLHHEILAAEEAGEIAMCDISGHGVSAGLSSASRGIRVVPVVGVLEDCRSPGTVQVDEPLRELDHEPEPEFDLANADVDRNVSIVPLTSSALAAVARSQAIESEKPTVTWSGKLLTEQESRQFFEIINQQPPAQHDDDATSVHSKHRGNAESNLVALLPEKFSVSPHVRSKEELL